MDYKVYSLKKMIDKLRGKIPERKVCSLCWVRNGGVWSVYCSRCRELNRREVMPSGGQSSL